MTTFFLGTHRPRWLERTDVPLFVSRTVMEKSPGELRDRLPVATTDWAMDSGGFWEITHRGGWNFTPRQYIREVQRARNEIGRLQWASPMDWMCEPAALKKTGLTVLEHQQRTVANYLELKSLDPSLPIIPVLQGFTASEYLECADLYEKAGVELAAERVVGLGSVCRRQATIEIDLIASMLHHRGLSLHGFGVKIDGLSAYAPSLTSADSLAWSDGGRRVHPCAHGLNRFGRINQSEANCIHYAMAWRRKILATLAAPVQLGLPYALN